MSWINEILCREIGVLSFTLLNKVNTSWDKTIKLNRLVVSNIFYCHPYLGKIPSLTNMFQRGWNHQLVKPVQQKGNPDSWRWDILKWKALVQFIYKKAHLLWLYKHDSYQNGCSVFWGSCLFPALLFLGIPAISPNAFHQCFLAGSRQLITAATKQPNPELPTHNIPIGVAWCFMVNYPPSKLNMASWKFTDFQQDNTSSFLMVDFPASYVSWSRRNPH